MTHSDQTTPWLRWAHQRPAAVALKVGQQTYTWQAVADRVAVTAASLQQQGIGPDDVVTLVGKNHPDAVWLFLATLHLGALTAFVPPQPIAILQRKLETIYRPAQTIWLFCAAPDDAAGLPAQLPNLRLVTVKNRMLSDHGGMPQPTTAVLSSHYQPEQLSTLIFTSGSTGEAKAVAHTSGQHFASAQGLLSQFHFTADDTWLLSLPIYHVSGLSIIYRWLQAGACLRIGRVEANELSDVTHASLVPTQLQRLLDQDMPHALTHVLLGGSYIPPALARRAAALGIDTWVGYGMTEAASTVTAKRVDGRESCGSVLPLRQVKIDQERIYIGGETLASGYYRQGSLTSLCDDSGWFDSKDMGYWHDQELCVTGRADNLFISGGENIHCEEIEAVLVRHPQIEAVVVVPVADATYGARPVAVIASAPDWLPSEASMRGWLDGRLEKFKWPDSYYRLPEHCRTQGIKISRAAVKTWLNAALKACRNVDPS
ncbi:o-succinylbenzoate--CoA ligase [Vibrio rhizosphaerae]|uniref:O-succinylbenzoate--CoA ligase n=1 Tax=Vibrio rhizosphaerae TaxID=398736 RepID=A0ABU4IU70_9VIBR|nr:o-succinylbenzoate--CoA ligase [Vibrio rhizosphaerae]MDW6092498.1 o-succinylbenzoate--CoA ligase [Vibrio rhizosphaerae]